MSAILVIGAHLDECEYGAGGISRKFAKLGYEVAFLNTCLLYTSPSPRDLSTSRMPSSA